MKYLIIFLIVLLIMPMVNSGFGYNILDKEQEYLGILGYEIVSKTSASTSADKVLTVSCSNGKKILGGGCNIPVADEDLSLHGCYPANNLTAWIGDAVETDPVGGSWTLTVYAICGEID